MLTTAQVLLQFGNFWFWNFRYRHLLGASTLKFSWRPLLPYGDGFLHFDRVIFPWNQTRRPLNLKKSDFALLHMTNPGSAAALQSERHSGCREGMEGWGSCASSSEPSRMWHVYWQQKKTPTKSMLYPGKGDEFEFHLVHIRRSLQYLQGLHTPFCHSELVLYRHTYRRMITCRKPLIWHLTEFNRYTW